MKFRVRPSVHVSQRTINIILCEHKLSKRDLQANKMRIIFEFTTLREGRCTLQNSMDQMCEGEGLKVEALLRYENIIQGEENHYWGMRIELGKPEFV